MSPDVPEMGDDLWGFPRVSGDEPSHGGGESGGLWFSPRERG